MSPVVDAVLRQVGQRSVAVAGGQPSSFAQLGPEVWADLDTVIGQQDRDDVGEPTGGCHAECAVLVREQDGDASDEPRQWRR